MHVIPQSIISVSKTGGLTVSIKILGFLKHLKLKKLLILLSTNSVKAQKN